MGKKKKRDEEYVDQFRVSDAMLGGRYTAERSTHKVCVARKSLFS